MLGIFKSEIYNFYQDIMRSGKLSGGLHIEDDDEPAAKYQQQSLDANRKKGNFEKDLDAMLFGGFGAPPPRRRPAAQSKPLQQPKPTQQLKPTTGPIGNITVPQTNTNKSNVTGNTSNIVPSKGGVPAKESTIGDVNKSSDSAKNANLNKSTDSGKNVNTNTSGNTINIGPSPKVVVKPAVQNPKFNNTKKEVSIIMQETTELPPINNIPIISQDTLPQVKKDNYVKPAQPKKEQKKVEEKKNQVPNQPIRYEEPVIIDVLHPFSAKNPFNKPNNIRKLKKIAEDFKFSQENVTLHSAVDVVRPFETDRNRQRKLNDFDFKDFQFPSASVSIGGEYKTKPSVWKKPNELAKTVCFGKYIDPNDINSGILSNPHFVSTVSAIAELEVNTKRLIEDQKANGNGFYLIRLFVNSVWRYVAVDSSLPFIENDHVGIVSNPDSEFQLSGALIEKAYAKTFGGYDTFQRVQPRQHYLRDLTGAPVKKYSIQNPDLASIIKKAVSSGQIVLAVANQKIAALGLNPNYSYPLINYTSKGGMELRNSFGTLEERSKISFRPEGTFDLGPAQVRDFISYILVTSINPAYSTATIQSKHRHGFYSSYNFKIRKDTHGFLSVAQWDERLFPTHSGYQYSPVNIVLHRVQNDGQAVFVNAAFSQASRNLDLEVNLTPGDYTVFVSANWKQREYAYNLVFYGSERVDFERVYTSKIPSLISQSLQSISVSSGKRTDLNKTSAQYFLYHPVSNLVVLTVENTSDRDGTVTTDLSKVKFDHLVLLTSHNNEEDYSNKVGQQIEQYKQSGLTDRRWSVSLGSKQRFSWVLATDQPYSESNPKSWGFN